MPKQQESRQCSVRLPIYFDVYGVRGAITGLRGVTPQAMARLLALFKTSARPQGRDSIRVAFKPCLRITEISVFITPRLALKRIWAIHAAGVVYKGGSFLFPGPSNSGKSTIARTALNLGLKIIGDDFVLFKQERKYIHLLPYFCAVHMDNEAKSVHLLPASSLAGGPLKAVIFPRISSGATCCSRIDSTIEALKHLWPRVLWADDEKLFRKQEECVRAMTHVPLFRMDLGKDMLSNPPLLLSVLDNILKES